MKRILGIIITSLSVLLFALSIYIIIGSAVAKNKNELFQLFGYAFAVVPTGSMAGDNPDSFDAGDAVIVYQSPYEALSVGDVIVYLATDGQTLIIHRIIEQTPLGFITQGDANLTPDTQLVTKADYRGKYVTDFKFFGIGHWLTDVRTVILSSMVLIFFIAIVYQIFKIIFEVKTQKHKDFEATLKDKEDTEL